MSNGSGLREHLLLLGRFLRDPRRVGAIAPSSQVLARAMVTGLDASHPVRIAELGPGTGAFTSAIAARIGPLARLLAIDIDPDFIERLRARWAGRAGLDFACASAAALPALAADRGCLPVDHIISGLPFASLPAAVTQDILAGIEQALRSGGTFTTFQYVHAYRLPAAVSFRRDLTTRLGSEPTRRLVVWNLPPAYVLTWVKR